MATLGVLYGLSADGPARKLGPAPAHGRELRRPHREAFRRFWEWSDAVQDQAMLAGELRTGFGWAVRVGPGTTPTSPRNFPMQASGAEMMRLVACPAAERGIRVCCPVHDAFLIEAAAEDIETETGRMRDAMRKASELVLPGFPLRTDAPTGTRTPVASRCGTPWRGSSTLRTRSANPERPVAPTRNSPFRDPITTRYTLSLLYLLYLLPLTPYRHDPRPLPPRGTRPARHAADLSALRRAPTLTRLPRPAKGEQYLGGPVPLGRLSRAAGLPGQALHLGAAIWFAAVRAHNKSPAVVLTDRLAAKFGLSARPTRTRALRVPAAGLVAVENRIGRPPVVTILPAEVGHRRPTGWGCQPGAPADGRCTIFFTPFDPAAGKPVPSPTIPQGRPYHGLRE